MKRFIASALGAIALGAFLSYQPSAGVSGGVNVTATQPALQSPTPTFPLTTPAESSEPIPAEPLQGNSLSGDSTIAPRSLVGVAGDEEEKVDDDDDFEDDEEDYDDEDHDEDYDDDEDEDEYESDDD